MDVLRSRIVGRSPAAGDPQDARAERSEALKRATRLPRSHPLFAKRPGRRAPPSGSTLRTAASDPPRHLLPAPTPATRVSAVEAVEAVALLQAAVEAMRHGSRSLVQHQAAMAVPAVVMVLYDLPSAWTS